MGGEGHSSDTCWLKSNWQYNRGIAFEGLNLRERKKSGPEHEWILIYVPAPINSKYSYSILSTFWYLFYGDTLVLQRDIQQTQVVSILLFGEGLFHQLQVAISNYQTLYTAHLYLLNLIF